MNNLYNNDITSLEYTGSWFIQVSFVLLIWFLVAKAYHKSEIEAEEQAKASNVD